MSGPFVKQGAVAIVNTGVCQPTIASVNAGDTLICFYSTATAVSLAAPTDSAGQTWSLYANLNGSGSAIAIAYLLNANAGTHTLSWATQTSESAGGISEWTGLTGIGNAAVLSSNFAVTTLASGSYTPSQANEVLIAVGMEQGSSNPDNIGCSTTAFGSIGTATDHNSRSCIGVSQDGATACVIEANAQVVTSTAAQTCTWTWTPANNAITVIGGFKYTPPAAGGGGSQVVSPTARTLRLGTPLSRLRGVYGDTVISTVTINETVGAYSWSGTTSTASGLINASVGSYSWAGTTATINDVINASVGAYSWSGTTAVNSGLINGIVGAYTWAGTTATTLENISGVVGAYTWAGTTATTSGLINAGVGAYTWAGTTSSLGGPIAGQVGAYTWSGTTATTSQLINSDGGASAYSWAGTTATASQLINSDGGASAYSWSGTTATTPVQISSDPTFGYVWSGNTATFGSQAPPFTSGSNAPTAGGGGGEKYYRSWSGKHEFKGDIDKEIAAEWARLFGKEEAKPVAPKIEPKIEPKSEAKRPTLTLKPSPKNDDEEEDEMLLMMIEQDERERIMAALSLLRRL